MSPVLATVVLTILIVVDRSRSSPPMANGQRQARASEKQSDVGVQRRSIRGNQVLDGVEEADWAPRALVGVNQRRRPSTLVADYDYDDDVVDKRYMRFGRRSSSDESPDDKRYMRFGRVGSHFHPLMGLAKRYMRFGRR